MSSTARRSSLLDRLPAEIRMPIKDTLRNIGGHGKFIENFIKKPVRTATLKWEPSENQRTNYYKNLNTLAVKNDLVQLKQEGSLIVLTNRGREKDAKLDWDTTQRFLQKDEVGRQQLEALKHAKRPVVVFLDYNKPADFFL